MSRTRKPRSSPLGVLGLVAVAIALAAWVAPAAAQLTAAQADCIATLDKGYAKISAAAGKDLASCVKEVGKGQVGPLFAPACFVQDKKGKVAKPVAKTIAGFVADCLGEDGGAPKLAPFAATDASIAATAARDNRLGRMEALFGASLDTALVSKLTDEDVAKCQSSLAKTAIKCHATVVKTMNACKKTEIGAGAADASAFAVCTADDRQKIAKACNLSELLPNGKTKVDKIRKDLAKKCVDAGADLTTAFPGCGSNDPEVVHACIGPATICSACEELGLASGLAGVLDCDALDNGAADDSCGNRTIIAETFTVASSAEPAETPGTTGVVVSHPELIEQFGGAGFDLNRASYTRWRLAGPEQTPDAVMVVVAGFGGGANNFKVLIEELIPKVLDTHGLRLEVWGFHRRTNLLEDREGSLLAQSVEDAGMAIDWYYGDDLGIALDPLLAAGPNRRANFYNTTDDIPFLANWTTKVFAQDIDAVVDEALAVASNGNVFLAGHSAGTGFIANYASTDFNFSGVGAPAPGHAKVRGLVLLEGGGGSTAGAPLSSDTLDRIEAAFDGALYAAVRDGAGRCADGVTPCDVSTEAIDCLAQSPPVCTPPVAAYNAIAGLGAQVTAASEPGAIQGLLDPDDGLAILQQNIAGPGTAPVDLVPELSLIGLLPNSSVSALFGSFLDDDGFGAGLSPALGTSLGDLGGNAGGKFTWIDIDESLPASATPDNGPAPTTLPASVWGQEVEVSRMDRQITTFTHAGHNAADWYFATSGLLLTSVAGVCSGGSCSVGDVGAGCATNSDCSQSISLDSTDLSIGRGRTDIVNLTQAPTIDVPVICFGGSNGLVPVPGEFVPFGESIGTCTAPSCDGSTARVVDSSLPNEAFPTFGGVAGGFEVHISEGYAHNDVVAAEDGPHNNVLTPLAAFIDRNVQ